MVTVLTVIGSPNPRSFVHGLAHEVGEALRSRGADVEEHDLYAEQFQPVAPAGEALTTGLDVEAAVAAATDPVVRQHRQAAVVTLGPEAVERDPAPPTAPAVAPRCDGASRPGLIVRDPGACRSPWCTAATSS